MSDNKSTFTITCNDCNESVIVSQGENCHLEYSNNDIRIDCYYGGEISLQCNKCENYISD